MNSLQAPLGSGYGDTTTAREVMANQDLRGKVVVITGGHSGIGLENTRLLSEAGATVYVGARDMAKAQKNAALPGVTIAPLDLANPRSIDEFAAGFCERFPKLDLLINNAGIMATPLARDARGFESQFSTNHLGHFQLSARLWPALKVSGHARVITLTSAGHRFAPVDFDDPNFVSRPYDKWKAYGQSKTANALFAVELDRRGAPWGIHAFSVHPGRIPTTGLARYMSDEERARAQLPPADGIRLKTIEQGAATTLWAALARELEGKGGLYCADCDVGLLVHEETTSSFFVRDYAVDPQLARRLWSLSEQLLGLTWPN